MIIPLSSLHQLRISRRKKIALTFLFALGTFAIIATIIRAIIAIADPTSVSKIMIWSDLEVTVSFFVANGPALRPLILCGPCGSSHDSDEERGASGYPEHFSGASDKVFPSASGRSGISDISDSFDAAMMKNGGTIVTVVGGAGRAEGEKISRPPPPSRDGSESEISVLRTVLVSVAQPGEASDPESLKTDLFAGTTNSPQRWSS
jgi:hypothetical protein